MRVLDFGSAYSSWIDRTINRRAVPALRAALSRRAGTARRISGQFSMTSLHRFRNRGAGGFVLFAERRRERWVGLEPPIDLAHEVAGLVAVVGIARQQVGQ